MQTSQSKSKAKNTNLPNMGKKQGRYTNSGLDTYDRVEGPNTEHVSMSFNNNSGVAISSQANVMSNVSGLSR